MAQGQMTAFPAMKHCLLCVYNAAHFVNLGCALLTFLYSCYTALLTSLTLH